MTISLQRVTIRLAYMLIDVVLICLSIFLACLLRQQTLPFEPTLQNIFFNPSNPYRFLFLFWIVTLIIFFSTRGLYQTRREIFEVFELLLLARTIALASLVVIVGIFGFKLSEFPRSVFLIGTAFNIVFLSAWRIAKRVFVQYIVAKGYNNFNALIVGAGRVGMALAQEIEKAPQLGIHVVGFLDDFKTNEDLFVNGALRMCQNGGTAVAVRPAITQIPILGKISDFRRIAQREFVNKVFITIHNDSQNFLKLLEEARDGGVAVRVVPQGFDLVTGEFAKYNIGFIPILEYADAAPLRKQVGKRLFDFVASFVGMIILAPVFAAIAVAIKLDSSGPVFYFSRRYGRRGRIFRMLKFRSMRQNADALLEELKDQNEVDGPIFKVRKDPRITRIGQFLRKYSLDELPQLFNVLKGDMSLVGPRPLPIDQIEKQDLKQLKRLEVRPGITGLWQIRGRSDISFQRLVRWDSWYINNWSFWLDINILFQTIPVVIKAKGAY